MRDKSQTIWIQFSSVAQSCLTLYDPMNLSTPVLPVHYQLPEFSQTHVYQELLFYKELYGLFNFWRLLFLSEGQFSSKWIIHSFEIWPKSNISHAPVCSHVFCQPLDLWWRFGFTLIARLGGLPVSIENFFFTIFF